MMSPAMKNNYSVISIRNMTRLFGDRTALNEIDLEIRPGTVVGILGPNGSGKTTLLRHIIGLLLPTSGTVKTFDTLSRNLDSGDLQRIGWVSQENELLDWLTVGETLDFVRASHPSWSEEMASHLVATFTLDRKDKVGALSVGNRQRLSIILAVAHKPDLLLLDEPAASLDPLARQEFLHLLMELIQDSGRTILISSHILTDVEKVIDQVLILDEGRIQCYQSLDELREEYYRVELTALGAALPTDIRLTGLKTIDLDTNSAVVLVHNPSRTQLETEIAALPCACTIRNLDFEEIYRLVVTRNIALTREAAAHV